jgi:hypothetical protein
MRPPPDVQAWYEDGGTVIQGAMLIIASGSPAVNQAIQFVPLLKRHVLGRFTVSQRKLNELWAPPELKFSTLYASTLRIVWLCLLYAPMYPPMCAAVAAGAWRLRCPALSRAFPRALGGCPHSGRSLPRTRRRRAALPSRAAATC